MRRGRTPGRGGGTGCGTLRPVFPMPVRVFFLALSAVCATCVAASPVGWVWTGGLTEDSAVITARIVAKQPAELEIAGQKPKVAPVLTESMDGGLLHRFLLTGLKADTLHLYRFVGADGEPLDREVRSFRTFSAPGRPASFRFAVSSCARATDSPVFAAVARQNPRFFVHTGDFHYSDIKRNEIGLFRAAYDAHLSAPRLRALLATTPMFYQWDDHDYGPNDSNKNSRSKEASLRNYRQLVPHYPLTVAPDDPVAPVDQAFTVGRVRFVLSDLRSQRDPAGKRMMNAAQDAWLRAQFLAARKDECPLIFWVSSVPWNGAPGKADRWEGYPAHRTEIADFIKANGLAGKVVVLAGDAHMTAIDDGSHGDFATGGGAPVRIFQAGPIANVGSYKGGRYSHGARFKSEPKDRYLHQFGLVDVADDGKEIRVSMSGREGADGVGDKVLLAERDAKGPIQFEFTVR